MVRARTEKEKKNIMKKKEAWVKPRHTVVRKLVGAVFAPYVKLKYHIKITSFKNPEKRQFLIVMNHQTAYDQFFVGLAFDCPVYYIASEDLFSMGWVSSLIRYLVAPIPIKKQTSDLKAVKNCVRVVKEGGTIALAPEGNRTYSGKMVYVKPSIIKLLRVLKLPLAIFQIKGGYGVQPRWSDVVRKGKMSAGVTRVIEPEEYKTLTDDELYDLILTELNGDETAVKECYYHKKNAEYLERVIYVCPHCGLSSFQSHNDILECKTCGRQFRYLPSKEFEGVNCEAPFKNVSDWYDYQCDFVNKLDYTSYLDTPMYEDIVCLSEVILYKNKKTINKTARSVLYGDHILIEQLEISFEQASTITVLGKNKLNIYIDDKVYQLKGDKSFNALKYVNMFYHYKNVSKGDTNEQFLGL